MLAKRIIPCLDVDQGRVVKGINFVKLREAGDPIEMGKFYNDQGADELVFLDITASSDNRKTIIEVARNVAKQVFIPFTVGGGIRTVEDMRSILLAGADKVSINTAALKNPQLISDGANIFGNQCIVLAIDAKRNNNNWKVYVNGGRTLTGKDVINWAKQGVSLGAGEILLTSINRDGTKSGYDLELTKKISESVNIPVIASGGAGNEQDFYEVFIKGKADATLAASLFHFGELKIKELKNYLANKQIPVR
ncbi:imidazole glycerol phosphate synthase subunit HisF [Candidatus Roizmanbacteria bacterium CG_4_10_14_0_8_um_filter_33_9]|uniref:Imidazole glycerol phosphate synthase subunit HisF n=1 Tax=Candidatus Roizmanbacteria bacterium CG_4_10_14_0_8_um_filter_33_9 TaxID=1974826 RepID=A0A2M7QJT1_9BACT|nr:MAG: imidazole glycerol phosphate synthase subunit HisF [Candidatus Roizmanbacteria bacterium CG_4_10_14_0_8_um_filter_33_9]